MEHLPTVAQEPLETTQGNLEETNAAAAEIEEKAKILFEEEKPVGPPSEEWIEEPKPLVNE